MLKNGKPRSMRCQKIALVYSAGAPIWQSAQTIRGNILRAYAFLPTECKIEKFETAYNSDDVKATIAALETLRPDIIVIPESYPVPTLFLQQLAASVAVSWGPEIHIHLYGDFTFASAKWLALESTLKQFAVRFYVASTAQKRLIGSFLNCTENSALELCPFPIREDVFKFEPEITSAAAFIQTSAPSSTHIENSGPLNLLYTGRLSRQKGVFLFLQWLARLRSESIWAQNIRIKFAGVFDDIGTPLWGDSDLSGTSFSLWQTMLKNHDFGSAVEYVGNLDKAALKRAYGEADAYVSLSLYHDEDYGMSPLEALSCGTPCVLTDWGGFGSFAVRPYEQHKDVALCRTHIDEGGVGVSYQDFAKALEALWLQKQAAQMIGDRHGTIKKNRSDFYHNHFGVRATGQRLADFLKTPATGFAGFTKALRNHALRAQRLDEGQPPYTAASKQDRVYYETYRNYVTPKSGLIY